jgi:hypothetical protein
MNNILYISGDGVDSVKQRWKIYFNYFDQFWFWKNYSYSKAFNTNGNNCDILNFGFHLKHLSIIYKLESHHIPGTTFLRHSVNLLIRSIIRIIIYRKIKTNLYSLIIFSDNLFFIEPELIKNIKRITSAKIILFSNISPHNLLPDIEKACVPDYDIIFISDFGHRIEWKELGAKKIVNLPISAASPEDYNNILYKNDRQKIYEVTFVGRLDNLHHHRLETLNYLVSQGVQLNIWTWDLSKEYLLKFPLLESALRGDAYGKEMVRVFAQSKIVINIHILSQPLGGNLRLFEIPATRSLQIADKCPQDWFKDGDEIVLYKDNQDLLQKINYFIENDEERERIAKNGYEKLVSKHQYKHRVKKIFESISIIG